MRFMRPREANRPPVFGLVLLISAGCASPATTPSLAHPHEQQPQSAAIPAPSAHAASVPISPSSADQENDNPELIEDDALADDAEERTLEELTSRPHPLDGWSAQQISEAVKNDLARLGSLSIGQPSAGALLNGVQAAAGPLLVPVAPSGAFGTQETLDYLSAAILKVHERFPATPPLSLGHISDRDGGPLSPHSSHQSGRDVDISFYYVNDARWYARATRVNLDLPRTWAFVRALITETDVEMILIDHSIQAWLKQHALESNEDPEWVESLFRGVSGKLRPLIRHAPGHATHVHVRFYNPIAQESARRCHDALVRDGKVRELASFIRHRARRGDTLGKLSKKYGVGVPAIKAANGLRTNLIREKREYRIPVRARPPSPSASPLRFPARRLPPLSVRVARKSPPEGG